MVSCLRKGVPARPAPATGMPTGVAKASAASREISRPGKIICRLQEEVDAARAQLDILTFQRARLTYKYSLLSALCEALGWVRLQQHKQQHPTADLEKGLGLASAEELAVLEQLKACPPIIPIIPEPEQPAAAAAATAAAACGRWRPKKHKAAQQEQQQEQQQDSNMQDNQHDLLAPAPSSPATHCSSRINNSIFQACSLNHSTSSSSFVSTKDSAMPAGTASSREKRSRRRQQQEPQQSAATGSWQPQQQQQQQQRKAVPAPTIAPAGDPMWLLRHLMSQPYPGMAGLTHASGAFCLKDLQAASAASVRELALALALCKPSQAPSPSPASTDTSSASNNAMPSGFQLLMPPEERVKNILCRHLQLLMRLGVCRQQQLVHGLTLSNLETGKLAEESCSQQFRTAMLQMGLTIQQQEAIADGLGLAKHLVTPLLSQLQQLHAELAAHDETPIPAMGQAEVAASSPSASEATAPAAAPAQAAVGPNGQAAAPVDGCLVTAIKRWKQLPLQQERANRLGRLLQKDWLLTFAFQCHVFGCLTWEQLGLLMVHSYPAALDVAAFAAEVSTQLDKQRKQQVQETKQLVQLQQGQQRGRQARQPAEDARCQEKAQ